MTTAHDLGLGDLVEVCIKGRIVGRSEFEDGDPSYLIQYERRGKTLREWFVADKIHIKRGGTA